MKWTTKAFIQNSVSRLPGFLGQALYFQLQRNFGNLKYVKADAYIQYFHELKQFLPDKKGFPERVLEIGTGRMPSMPILFFLAGAQEIVTVDLNPYLHPVIVRKYIDDLLRHRQQVDSLLLKFTDESSLNARWNVLVTQRDKSLGELLSSLGVRYLAPQDARHLPHGDKYFDLIFSTTVFEHIPFDILQKIIEETQRVLRPTGKSIHLVDFSDHFSHSDSSITAVNFLQFDEKQWARWAGNSYMYHNRRRLDDYQNLFAEMELPFKSANPHLDLRALECLQSGFPLAEPFKGKPHEINAYSSCWFVFSRK